MIRRILRNTGFSRRIAPNSAEILATNQIDIVLGVGANDGGYGREIFVSGSIGRIHSLESNLSVFKRLSASIAKDTLYNALPYCAGQDQDTLELNVLDADVFSSFKALKDFREESINTKVDNIVEAKVVLLGDYLTNNPELLGRPYLQVDTQGLERDVL